MQSPPKFRLLEVERMAHPSTDQLDRSILHRSGIFPPLSHILEEVGCLHTMKQLHGV
jgi:hypothetical protein